MTGPAPSRPTWRPLLLGVLFAASCLPLLFLDLDKASQFASAVALPLSVFLFALPSIPAISARKVPWRRYSLVAAVVVALLGTGGVGYAVWQGTKDIDFAFPADGPGDPWTDGSETTVLVPGSPPERERVTLVVSLSNANKTGDCAHTAKVDFIPVIDGKERDPVERAPGEAADVPLTGAARKAEVKIVLHYSKGNANCKVLLRIDKAVLHD